MSQSIVRRLPISLLAVAGTFAGLLAIFDLSSARAQVVASLRGDYDANGPYAVGQLATGLTDTSGAGTWEFHRSPHRDFVGGRPVVEPLAYFGATTPIVGSDFFRDATNSPWLGTPSIGANPLFTVQPGPASDELAVHSAENGYSFPYLWLIWTSGITAEVNIGGWFHNISTDGGTAATYDGAQLVVYAPALNEPDATIDPLQSVLAPQWAATTMNSITNRVHFSGGTLSGVAVEPGSQLFFLIDPLGSWAGDNSGLQIEISIAPEGTPGDFDNDGDVDGADFVAWQTNFPNTSGTATLGMGDGDSDGDVDGADFSMWQDSFPASTGQTSPVPEPTTIILLVLGGSFGLATGRRPGQTL